MIEDDTREFKSIFDGSQSAKLHLVKTLVSFANTAGGELLYEKVSVDRNILDPARVDDLVNRYVEPGLAGIRSYESNEGRWIVSVPVSPMRPHVFKSGETIKDRDGKVRSAFHEGQIYVRASTKCRPANGDDITRLINERLASFLAGISNAFKATSIAIASDGEAVPVRIAIDAPLSLAVGDVNQLYPFIARTLGKLIGKGQNWVAAAAKQKGMKANPVYCYTILGSDGKPAQVRYSMLAKEVLLTLSQQDDYSPYQSTKVE